MKQLKLQVLTVIVLLIGLMAFGGRKTEAARSSLNDNQDGGAQLYVDDDKAQCPNAQYTSIQAAVTAAHPGDTINVCPGTYHEQVKITKALTVRGISVANQNQAIVMPAPAAPNSISLATGDAIAAIILVDGASKVTLQNLTVDGSTSGITACAPELIGVYYRNSSGIIDSLAVRNIKLGTGFEGCQSGQGIFVQSGNGGKSLVAISNNSVHDYQKNGITANEVGTQVAITGNAVSGIGATPNIAQNGIQVGYGAQGLVDSNSVINHIYSLCTSTTNCAAASTNILIYQSDGVAVTRNTTGKAQVNVYYQGNKGIVGSNTIFESDIFDGIDLVGNQNSAVANSIFNSQEAGIYVLGNKNQAQGNDINEAPDGVLEDSPSSGNNYSGNKFYNTGMNIVTPPPTTSNTANTLLIPQTVTPSGRTVQPATP